MVWINPEAFYDDSNIYGLLGISISAITRSRLDGSLRFTRAGKRVFYLGQWIIDWLTHNEVRGR